MTTCNLNDIYRVVIKDKENNSKVIMTTQYYQIGMTRLFLEFEAVQRGELLQAVLFRGKIAICILKCDPDILQEGSLKYQA